MIAALRASIDIEHFTMPKYVGPDMLVLSERFLSTLAKACNDIEFQNKTLSDRHLVILLYTRIIQKVLPLSS